MQSHLQVFLQLLQLMLPLLMRGICIRSFCHITLQLLDLPLKLDTLKEPYLRTRQHVNM